MSQSPMSQSPTVPETNGDRTATRRPWTPLDFEKIDAKDAESGFIGVGADNTFYS